ncbi:MAG: Uma2 family endonuclease [Candidatus Sericytochromatia bacterium]|uniref:Uma2 family endonuclease n=1 Tax=Candidatus Tanganyikabacteria bacterium TaxID=2961651 RepID=A0A937X2C6_9BACT|nr:Uma2 family endonuclease [Candidatus Tanganyikabacteria bacterium]
MAIENSRRLLTYDDYAALPDDGKKYELIHGELILCPSASKRHQGIGARLIAELEYYRKAHPDLIESIIYDFDVNPAPHETVRPDLLVFFQSRKHISTNRKATEVPDIVGEILSRDYPYDLRENTGRSIRIARE